MSKKIIEAKIHYGQEDFKKLFEGLIKSTIASQDLPCKNNNQLDCGVPITEVHRIKEDSEAEQHV